jgi:hypothetical protein
MTRPATKATNPATMTCHPRAHGTLLGTGQTHHGPHHPNNNATATVHSYARASTRTPPL